MRTVKRGRPFLIEHVIVTGVKNTQTVGLRAHATAIRLTIPQQDGTQNEIEFIIAARHKEDLQSAVAEMEHWNTEDLLDMDRVTPVVLLQTSHVLMNDEL